MPKTITVNAKIIEIGDNVETDKPEIYLLQEGGNRIFIDVNRDWLIDLVRGKKEKFSVYEDVELTITISKIKDKQK